MAEILLKARLETLALKGFSVKSAGIKAKKGEPINEKSAQALLENGLDAGEFTATRLTDKTLREAFVIVCMTAAQRDYLMERRWVALKKAGEEAIENNVYAFSDITGYEISDPYGKDIDCYRYVFNLLSTGVNLLTDRLRLAEYAHRPKEGKSGAICRRGRPKKSLQKTEENP